MLPLSFRLTVQTAVIEIKQDTKTHHNGVQDIEEPHITCCRDPIYSFDGLNDDSKDKPNTDEEVKQDTGPLGGIGF